MRIGKTIRTNVWAGAVVCLLTSGIVRAATVAHWTFDEGRGRYTANQVDSSKSLQFGRYLNDTIQDPEWRTVDGYGSRHVAAFRNYNDGGKVIYCRPSPSWTEADYAALSPQHYTFEMVFQYSELPPNEGTWDSNFPHAQLTMTQAGITAPIYMARVRGARVDFITKGGTFSHQSWPYSYEMKAGDWIYWAVSYDGTSYSQEIQNLSSGTGATVFAADPAMGQLLTDDTWTPGAAGYFSVGSEVINNGSYRRSIDGQIDEVRLSNSSVAEADKLYRKSWPATVDTFEGYLSDEDLNGAWTYEGGAYLLREATTVHGRNVSLKYTYDSLYGNSVAYRTYAQPQDFSRNGDLTMMELYFYGDTNNSTAETLYIKLTDSSNASASVAYPNSADLAVNAWTVWRMDMADFTGVDLSSISKVEIGFLTNASNGVGIVYFDDIRVHYPCRSGQLEFDFNDDCTVDMNDFASFASEWLETKTY